MIAILVILAGACGKDSQSPPGQGSQLSQAQTMFNSKCARCHGINGDAKGPSSDSLSPRPRNYTDPAWQASVTDDQIKEIIVRGGVNMGKSPAMPGNPPLKNRPEVLDGLVQIIRGFGKRP